MNYDTLSNLVSQGLSSYQIAKRTNKSQTTISYWLKKHNLKTNININTISSISNETHKKCAICNEYKILNNSNFYSKKNSKFYPYCIPCHKSHTISKIKERKRKLVEYKGGKCINCGYNKYLGALAFHHLDPSKKEFSIAQLKTYSFEKLKTEVDKCVLLCHNCHAELHANLIFI